MKIMDISERCCISTDTLRYNVRIGLIPPIHRIEGRIRDYNEPDLRRVEFIKCIQSAGLPVEALNAYMGLVQAGDLYIEDR